MKNFECIPLALFFLTFGAALGSIGVIAGAKIAGKEYRSSRFVEFCLLLSCAVICATWALFVSQDYLLNYSNIMAGDIVYFASVFAAGVLCALWWKIFVPLVAVVYISLGFYGGIFLYTTFGLSENTYSVTVDYDSISAGEKAWAFKNVNGKQLRFAFYETPAKLVFPVASQWSSLEAVTGSGDQAYGDEYVIEPGNFLNRYILSQKQLVFVPLPETHVFPAEYQIKIFAGKEGVEYQVTKSF